MLGYLIKSRVNNKIETYHSNSALFSSLKIYRFKFIVALRHSDRHTCFSIYYIIFEKLNYYFVFRKREQNQLRTHSVFRIPFF